MPGNFALCYRINRFSRFTSDMLSIYLSANYGFVHLLSSFGLSDFRYIGTAMWKQTMSVGRPGFRPRGRRYRANA
jgi:hypothetical protein